MNRSNTPARRMSYREWKIRKCLRLARNWVLFLAACGGAVALMASGILWLLPKAHALIAGPVPFTALSYDGTDYAFDAADARLVVANPNLPLEEAPAPELAVADEATGEQLEAEAAAAYRRMAEAAQADSIELQLASGWQEAETTSEQGTGYCADILEAGSSEKTEAFAKTRAYEWLTAYAADYGFILRWPEERQSATGMGFTPWHWRYVGVENARAIRESGLSLEEFVALERAKETNEGETIETN